MSEEIKNYMIKGDKRIDEIVVGIKKDADAQDSKSRFGFFSIPYATHIGDKHYSQTKKSRRTDDKKVLTDARGIFTKPPKTGKMNDALFIDLVKEEKETLNRFKEMTDKDREDFLKKVESRKKKGQPEGEFKAKFKPGGPQDYIDL